MEPKDIGTNIYTVVFMSRIQYEILATFIFCFFKYIVFYTNQNIYVLSTIRLLLHNFIYSHVRDRILSSIKYDLVQRCIKILQGS